MRCFEGHGNDLRARRTAQGLKNCLAVVGHKDAGRRTAQRPLRRHSIPQRGRVDRASKIMQIARNVDLCATVATANRGAKLASASSSCFGTCWNTLARSDGHSDAASASPAAVEGSMVEYSPPGQGTLCAMLNVKGSTSVATDAPNASAACARAGKFQKLCETRTQHFNGRHRRWAGVLFWVSHARTRSYL